MILIGVEELVEWGDSEGRFGPATLPTEYIYGAKKRIMSKTRRGPDARSRKSRKGEIGGQLQQWTRGSNSIGLPVRHPIASGDLLNMGAGMVAVHGKLAYNVGHVHHIFRRERTPPYPGSQPPVCLRGSCSAGERTPSARILCAPKLCTVRRAGRPYAGKESRSRRRPGVICVSESERRFSRIRVNEMAYRGYTPGIHSH